MDCLDIKIIKKSDGTLSTDLYCKPTDSHICLLYSSEHPRHLLKGIPISQFLRVKCICSENTDFLSNVCMLAGHFIRCGYPCPLALNSLERAEKLDRKFLLDKQLLEFPTQPIGTKHQKTNFYCVTTHNPNNPPLRDIISKNLEILGKTKTTRPLLDTKIIFGLRRNKNFVAQTNQSHLCQKLGSATKKTTADIALY